MIAVERLTKRFGPVLAVDDLSFEVPHGSVTGFLGPNGAGKTTTLRALLGLVAPTSGSATIDGRRYADLADPVGTVGASLEASGFHPGRTGQDHLRVLCLAAGLPPRRADDVLALVGMTEAGGRRVGGYSLGMRQRLALAGALLGEPSVLLLDEPANGLDPEGIAWLRGFLRHYAAQGATVLVSSHVLAEVEQTADHVVIINRGRLVRAATLADLASAAGSRVLVRTPDADRLAVTLRVAGATVTVEGEVLTVEGTDAPSVGRLALREGVELHELTPAGADLERIFLSLTDDGGAP